MTDKEQIIINGKKQYCKILFRCKHIDDTAAYDMMCEGIEIKPENAPIGDFELMLIENTDSPFGFSFVCKRNNKEDVWEHSGFGNSGACSLVTALLKQLARKTQECEELKGRLEYIRNENKNLKDSATAEQIDYVSLKNYISTLEFAENRYRKALEEIVSSTLGCGEWIGRGITKWLKILDIINKAKGTDNE